VAEELVDLEKGSVEAAGSGLEAAVGWGSVAADEVTAVEMAAAGSGSEVKC